MADNNEPGNKAYYLFSFRDISVYELIVTGLLFGVTHSYYWKYRGSNYYYGPYPSVDKAVNHYLHETDKARLPKPQTNLLKINFKTKKKES